MSVLEQLAQELAALLSGPYPRPRGSQAIPWGDSGVTDLQGVLGQMVEGGMQESDGDGRTDWREAGYRAGGTYPFVCAECSMFCEDSSCTLVVGPHDGLVAAQDVCRYWEPADPPGADADQDDSSDAEEGQTEMPDVGADQESEEE